LVLAYATTIHKSQGSEYPAVVIPLTTQHYPMRSEKATFARRSRSGMLFALTEIDLGPEAVIAAPPLLAEHAGRLASAAPTAASLGFP
jgi:hypothetical protein